MIRLRKECPEIGWGDWQALDTGSSKVLAMRYDWGGNSLVTIHNFDEKSQEIKVTPGVPRGDRLVNLMVEEESRATRTGVHRIGLESYGYKWFRVGDLNYWIGQERD
jgi:maltose alpha-D-glucosyltransferase/alpha-amylase